MIVIVDRVRESGNCGRPVQAIQRACPESIEGFNRYAPFIMGDRSVQMVQAIQWFGRLTMTGSIVRSS